MRNDPHSGAGWATPPTLHAVRGGHGYDADRRETEELRYLIARDEWLAGHAPDLARGAPVHECGLLVPGSYYGDEVSLDEFDDAGLLSGARWLTRGRHAFGAADEVLSAVVEDEAEDAWVQAIVRALKAKRAWTRRSRRPFLEVWKGNGELVHLTAAANRESIRRWGLDWSRMGKACGIAGSVLPELPAIFLDTMDSVGFFKMMAKEPVDLWAVDVTELWVENGPDGWFIHQAPIGPDRLRLLEGDWYHEPRRPPNLVPKRPSGGRQL